MTLTNLQWVGGHMLKRKQLPICLVSARCGTLPTVGQRVQITLLKDIELWQGRRRVPYHTGAVYSGTATSVSADGTLELLTDAGQQLQVYAYEPAFQIDLLAEA